MEKPGEAHTGVMMSDEELLAALGATLGSDSVPERVMASARAAYTWRTIDAELAALSFDSLLADDGLATVRSVGMASRLLTFEASHLTVEIQVCPEGHHLVGQLVPPQSARVEVQHPGGTMSVPADELGRFSVEALPGRLIRLCCRVADDDTAIETEWITL